MEDEELWPERDDGDVTFGRGEEVCGALQRAGSGEALMAELSERVQEVVRSSGWWERHGVDICILSCSLLALPAGKNPPLQWGSRCFLAAFTLVMLRAREFVCVGSLLAACQAAKLQ